MQAGRLDFHVHVPVDDEKAAEILSSAEDKDRGRTRSRSRDLDFDFDGKSLPSTPLSNSKESLNAENFHPGDLHVRKNVDGSDDGDLERGEGGTKMSGNGARVRVLFGGVKAWFRGIWMWMLQGIVRISEKGAGKGLLLAVLLIAVLTFVLGLFVGLAVGFGST